MTIIETIKLREQQNRKLLLELLMITDEELTAKVFAGAFEYLEKVFGTDAYGMEHLPRTPQFWAWWTRQWNDIDSVFLGAIERHHEGIYIIRSRDNELSRYCLHSIESLREHHEYYHQAHMNNRYLNSNIVRAGMHKMIESIVNQSKEVCNG